MSAIERLEQRIKDLAKSRSAPNGVYLASYYDGRTDTCNDILGLIGTFKKQFQDGSLLEKLAELEHKQWSHWTRHFLEFQNPLNIAYWKTLAHAPYSKLDEKQKESDRDWARKVIELVKLRNVIMPREKLVAEKNLLELKHLGELTERGQGKLDKINEWLEITS